MFCFIVIIVTVRSHRKYNDEESYEESGESDEETASC